MKFKAGDKVTVRKDLKTGWHGAELKLSAYVNQIIPYL